MDSALGVVAIAVFNFWWLKRHSVSLAKLSPQTSLPAILSAAGVGGLTAAFIDRGDLSASAVGTLGSVAAWIDFQTHRLPTELTVLLGCEVLVCTWPGTSPQDMTYRVGGALLWSVWVCLGHALGAIGYGDVLLAPVLGFWLGSAAGLGLIVAIILSGVHALTQVARRRDRIPFGPSLLLGSATAWALVTVA